MTKIVASERRAERLGLVSEVADAATLERAATHCRARGITLPTFAELAAPDRAPTRRRETLARVGPDEAHAANLFRVHWFNARDRTGQVPVPDHVVLPKELTGVDAPILVAIGRNFPMIRAHKVLAAYACLAPRLVTGHFDPERHRAVWPSTGNYCRGGVAISRILGCHGVAVLPEGMSRERFDWLAQWVLGPSDVVRTPGTESNVKEIYDRCAVLERDPRNAILNQFREFGNHLAHYEVTGRAIERVFEAWSAGERPGSPGAPKSPRLAAFVSATGSAGTIAAGDRLKDSLGARIAAVEALECPTLYCNGFGEHNIQGIGDKHVPLIHNATNTDVVVAISDKSTDALNVLFNTDAGRRHLARRGVSDATIGRLGDFGLSSIANVLAAIVLAKMWRLGPDEAIATVATDGAEMYASEIDKIVRTRLDSAIDDAAMARIDAEHLAGAAPTHVLELDRRERDRVFNLGYFTWVEQRGVLLEDFECRRDQGFWRGLRSLLPVWDELIREFNARVGVVT